jgi:predicted O-methyltransferase YrrM
MFEFGTCTGKTAYLWATNSPSDAQVVTLTLPPDQAEHGDRESSFVRFIYTGTPVERKIVQLFGDSRTLNVDPYKDQCDLVFVDGSHRYEFVVSDSWKALAMVRPGGLVLWHDYSGAYRNAEVYRALNELRRDIPLRHVRGTSLVCYRRPG